MKIAYFGGDWFLSCLEVWQINGHEIAHVFCHGEASYNEQLRQWAQKAGIPVTQSKPDVSTIQTLLNQGVDCLFCIEYPWLIPTENLSVKTLNVHPSMLPEGRGPTPMSWTILKYPEAAGVSFHKMNSEFDMGDIIFQRAVKLAKNETLDTYLTKLELLIPRMLNELLSDFEHYYLHAKAQDKGSYWPRITLNDRKINWHSHCDAIRHQSAAAGQFGVVIVIDDQLILVKHIQCSELEHELPPGTVFKQDSRTIAIATFDGICLIDRANIIEQQPLNEQLNSN